MPRTKSEKKTALRELEGVDLGPEWTEVSLSDVDPLPTLAKNIVVSNPNFLARSHHSQVYTIDLTDHGKTTQAVLKLFPKGLKHRYTKEVNAYRFLYHFGAPDDGVVPKVFGVLPSINKKKLDNLLQDSIPDDVSIPLPAYAVVMEYIQGAVRPSPENMTHAIAEETLRALKIIHNSHVLHGDAEGRNILVRQPEGTVVWIDFSSSEINTSVNLAVLERRPVKQFLYATLVWASFHIIIDNF
jgi:serine/threonine protein kinase